MTNAEWMLFAAVLLFLLTLAPVKVLGPKRFDNSNPRDPAFYTPGIAARALGAHLNGIEIFPSSRPPCCWRNFAMRRSMR